MCLRGLLGAVQAVVATHVECGLTAEFGVEWVPRVGGAGNEIAGITQQQMDAYSSRTVAITERLPEAAASWTAKYGRAPSRRELLYIRQEVTMASRHGKDAGVIDNGTRWRLRSLVAMGHDATRIATALRAHPRAIGDLLSGGTATVTPELRAVACQLWDAWWDKRPPERSPAERCAAAQARRRAEQRGWCTPLGLDEDLLDQLGYRPYTKYRPAAGTGTAAAFRPAARATAREST